MLVAGHGMLAGAEMAIAGVKTSRVRELAVAGDAAATAVDRLRDQPERFLSTVRTGMGLLATAAGVIAGVFVERDLEPLVARFLVVGAASTFVATVLVVAVTALLNVTLGELVPQSLALHAPEAHALRAGRPLDVVASALRPLAWFATATSNLLLRPFGAKTSFMDSRLSEQELHHLVDEAAKVGTVDPAAGAIASRAIDFGRLTAADVMVPRNDVVAISVHASRDELQRTLLETGHSRLPVFEKTVDEILGYISAKDVLALAFEQALFVLHDIVRPAYFVPESMRAVTLLRELQERCIHLAFVSDAEGGFAGIVTMEDLLEEIVGEIFSEHDDRASLPIRRSADGSIVVEGTVTVRDLNRELSLSLPESGEWSTVAGFCIVLAGRIPRTGDELRAEDGTMFEILDASQRRVRSVRVRPR